MNCPDCKSENIKYFKKKQTAPGENTNDILCVCQNCGNKWKRIKKSAVSAPRPVSRPHTQVVRVPVQKRNQPLPASVPDKPQWTKQERVLQKLLAVLLWPVTITYWFYENRVIKMKKNTRIGVICAMWLIFLAGISGLVYIGTHPKPRVELDYSVSTTVNVSTAQFATTTKPKKDTKESEQSTTNATTTVNSIFS